MYPRRVRRIIRKVKTRRFKRSRFYRPTRRSSNIIRRSLRRRPLRPEVKYIDINSRGNQIESGVNSTFTISPTTMAQGDNEGQRHGNEVNFRRLVIRHDISCPPSNIGAGLAETDDKVRYVLWTPRLDSTMALRYMGSIDSLTIIDWNVVTIHKDYMLHMTRPQQPTFNATGTITGYEPNGTSMKKFLRISMPFPRRVKFAPTTVTDFININPDKDVLYCTIYNTFGNGRTGTDNAVLSHSYSVRVTYTDA